MKEQSENSIHDRRTIAATVITILTISYFSSVLRFHDNAHIMISILFGVAIFDVTHRYHDNHQIHFYQPDAFLGGGLMGLIMVVNSQFNHFYFIRLTPFLSGITFILLFFGFRGLQKYWRELSLLFFLGAPSVIAQVFPDPSPLAAIFASSTLNLFNLDVLQEGKQIFFAATQVSVFRGCSGLEYMTYLLGLSVMFLLSFPVSGVKRYITPVIGILIGFIVNGFRVTLLTLFAITENRDSFIYWHEGQGSLLFGCVAVILFGSTYWLMLRKEYYTSRMSD